MMQLRVLVRTAAHPDGEGVIIIHPAPQARREKESDEQFHERIFTTTIAKNPSMQGLAHFDVNESEIPTDRTFRNAWKAASGRIEHDMDKAREIQKERLRALRAPLLVALDVDFMRAIEAGDVPEQIRIAEQKQQLRDVTDDPAIAAATTPEQLKAAVPEMLA